MKDKFPIFAQASPGKVGERFIPFEKDGQTFEVIRNLTLEEARKLAPEFVAVVLSQVPPGTPIYWVECKKVEDSQENVKNSSEIRRCKIDIDPNHQLYGELWVFQKVSQMNVLEREVMEKDPKLLNKLSKGCFYFSQMENRGVFFWVFIYCDDVPRDACAKVAQLAKRKGGFQVEEFPDKKNMLENAARIFRERMGKFSPGQIFERKSIH